jgi:hypothetical protein
MCPLAFSFFCCVGTQQLPFLEDTATRYHLERRHQAPNRHQTCQHFALEFLSLPNYDK